MHYMQHARIGRTHMQWKRHRPWMRAASRSTASSSCIGSGWSTWALKASAASSPRMPAGTVVGCSGGQRGSALSSRSKGAVQSAAGDCRRHSCRQLRSAHPPPAAVPRTPPGVDHALAERVQVVAACGERAESTKASRTQAAACLGRRPAKGTPTPAPPAPLAPHSPPSSSATMRPPHSSSASALRRAPNA